MKRIRLVLGLACVLVAMLVVTAVPAMARTVGEERGESAQTQAAEENHNFTNSFRFNPFFTNSFFVNPFFTTGFSPSFICFNNGTAFGCLNSGFGNGVFF